MKGLLAFLVTFSCVMPVVACSPGLVESVFQSLDECSYVDRGSETDATSKNEQDLVTNCLLIEVEKEFVESGMNDLEVKDSKEELLEGLTGSYSERIHYLKSYLIMFRQVKGLSVTE